MEIKAIHRCQETLKDISHKIKKYLEFCIPELSSFVMSFNILFKCFQCSCPPTWLTINGSHNGVT